MIGYKLHRRTKYYHRAEPKYGNAAVCNTGSWLTALYGDDQEAELRKAAPHLSRCSKCWKEKK